MSPRKRVKVDTSVTEDASHACARRDEIIEKLKALGYGDEDLDPRFDEDDWKWNTLLDNDSLSSEHSWEKIQLQLEDTIKLRRDYKASEFSAWRRSLREGEMKARFSQYRPQLEHLTLHKLFLDADLLELPVVKELMEENEYRIPLTEDRWLTVQNILVQAVLDHAIKIEKDCYDEVIQAKYEAKDIAKDRWSEERDKRWEEREAEIDREEEENGVDSEDSDYERPWNPKILDEPPDDLIELEEDYEFDCEGREDGSESIPLCLLSAQSFLEQDFHGVKRLFSFAEILRERATRPLLPDLDANSDDRVSWCKERFSSSGQTIDIAVLLLRQLGLSPRTRMAYMAACGNVFKCIRCFRGAASKGVIWSRLVQHFVYEYSHYNELCEINYTKNAGVPLRNDHTLDKEESLRMGYGVPALMPRGLGNKAGGSFTDAGRLYIELAPTWGRKIPPSLVKFIQPNEDEPVGIPWRDLDNDSSDDLAELMDKSYDEVYSEKCGLCAKLGVAYAEKSRILLNDHLKRKHGVDEEGNLLKEVNDDA